MNARESLLFELGRARRMAEEGNLAEVGTSLFLAGLLLRAALEVEKPRASVPEAAE